MDGASKPLPADEKERIKAPTQELLIRAQTKKYGVSAKYV